MMRHPIITTRFRLTIIFFVTDKCNIFTRKWRGFFQISSGSDDYLLISIVCIFKSRKKEVGKIVGK